MDIEVLPLAVEEPEEIYMLESAPLPTQYELDNETDAFPFPSQYQPETNPSPSEQQPETFPTPTEPLETQTDPIEAEPDLISSQPEPNSTDSESEYETNQISSQPQPEQPKTKSESEGSKSNNDDGRVSESKEEEPVARMAKQIAGNVYKPIEDGKIMLEVGTVFDTMYHYRSTLLDYSV